MIVETLRILPLDTTREIHSIPWTPANSKLRFVRWPGSFKKSPSQNF